MHYICTYMFHICNVIKNKAFMTTYQKHWNAEIESLLKELNSPQSFEKNIIDTLNNARRTGIFPNQIINALSLGLSIKQGNRKYINNNGFNWIS